MEKQSTDLIVRGPIDPHSQFVLTLRFRVLSSLVIQELLPTWTAFVSATVEVLSAFQDLSVSPEDKQPPWSAGSKVNKTSRMRRK